MKKKRTRGFLKSGINGPVQAWKNDVILGYVPVMIPET